MSKNIRFFFIFILGFIVYYLFDFYCFKIIQEQSKEIFHSKAIAHILAYSITIIPLIGTAKILFPKKHVSDLFSLNQPVSTGFILSFFATLPMLIGYSVFFSLSKELNIESLFINTISSAFFEELIFRAFLIGLLFKFTKLGFITSILLASSIFAQAHLYQGSTTIELIQVFSITFLGSILFAWVYSEWNFNIWTAIFLHFFMNLYWSIFVVDNNAAGNTLGNIFRFASIFLVILLTIYHKKRKKIPLQVTWKSLFIKSKEIQS